MPTKIFYQKHRKTLLKKQRDFHHNNKEVIKEQARIKYHNLSTEEKNKTSEFAKKWYNGLPDDKKNIKREYGKNRYRNMTDEEMQKHKAYQKINQKMYREKKKQELKNIKRLQDNFDKNAVVTTSKTILYDILIICTSTFYSILFFYSIFFFFTQSSYTLYNFII